MAALMKWASKGAAFHTHPENGQIFQISTVENAKQDVRLLQKLLASSAQYRNDTYSKYQIENGMISVKLVKASFIF